MRLLDGPENPSLDKFILSGSVFVAAVALLFLCLGVGLAIINGSSLDHVSGAWIAIAMDLRDGVFYRPLFDESIGYGGTRFFPLSFTLIALVSNVLDSALTSGHVVSVLSGLLLLVSCYLFMRRSEVRPFFALILCVLLLSSDSIRFGFQAVRGDILPLALNILGLAVYLDKSLGKKSLYIAAGLFVLAFSAKVTAIHGVTTLFLWLMMSGHRREGVTVLLLTLSGCMIFLGLMNSGTSGRVFEIFEVCASGGTTIATLLKAPIKFTFNLSAHDQAGLVLLFWAVVLFFYRIKDVGVSLPAVFVFVSLVLTVGLYGSPGITANHLVDIVAASVLFIAYAAFSANASDKRASAGIYIFLITFLIFKSLWVVKQGLAEYELAKSHFPEQLVTLVKDSEGIVMAEDPALLAFNNKKPFLLDPYMLNLSMKKDEDVSASVISDISSQKYEVVVFDKDPVKNHEWYADVHFGSIFMEMFNKHYRESERVGGYVIYRPL